MRHRRAVEAQPFLGLLEMPAHNVGELVEIDDDGIATGLFFTPLPMVSLRRTPPSDLDLHRSAHLWIQTHGDATLAKAREMVETMRAKGEEEGADIW